MPGSTGRSSQHQKKEELNEEKETRKKKTYL